MQTAPKFIQIGRIVLNPQHIVRITIAQEKSRLFRMPVFHTTVTTSHHGGVGGIHPQVGWEHDTEKESIEFASRNFGHLISFEHLGVEKEC